MRLGIEQVWKTKTFDIDINHLKWRPGKSLFRF